MNSRNAPATPAEVLKKFRLIYGTVRQHFREIERSCGISGSQLWLLKEVGQSPGVGVSELASRLSIHQSTCSQLLEKLVAGGLIIKARGATDRRRVALTLSPGAVGLLARAPGPAEGVLPDALRSMPGSSLTRLDAALSELLRKIRINDARMADRPLAEL